MKFVQRSCTALAVLISSAAIQGRAAGFDGETGTWTVNPAFTTHYLFRGVELAGACFQPWVDYTIGPMSVGIWSSIALEDQVGGDADPEIDLYGSYTFTSRSGAFGIQPGFYLYTYPDADRSKGVYKSTFEPSLAAIFNVAGIQFTPKVYYDVMLEGATYEMTAALALPLTALGTELDFSATAGTFKWRDVTADAMPAVKNWGDYWSMGVAVPVQISLRSRLTLALTYSEGRDNFFKQGTLPRVRNAAAHGKTAFTVVYALTL
jgi:uncharacterized protein (TIGR02001 family)